MSKLLFRRKLVSGVVAVAAVAASGRWSWATPAPPLRIGVSLGLSGNYAHDSLMQSRAYQLWARHANARGGILGRPVELVIRDDRSDPATARQIYQDFVTRDKLDCVFGPFSSGITLAVAPITERHGYPMLAAGAASDEIWRQGYRYIFGTIPPAGRQTIGLLAVLADAGIDRLAIVQADDAYSLSLADGARKWSAEYGIRIDSLQQIAKGTPDLGPMARAARESGARALLMAGHFDESINMRRALKRIGWVPAAYYASVGPTLDQFATLLKGDEEGVLATSTWEAREELPLPGSADFLREFVASYATTPSFIAAQAYAAGQILERAVAKAGSTERGRLRDALAVLDTNVIIGRYAVDRSGMLTKRIPLIVQWQKGRREIVWPPETRTAPPRLAT